MAEEKQTNGAAENGVKTEKATDLEKKIIRQVEHYFGDYNLPRDKFLQEAVKLDEGWVDMETMLKFKRLSQLSEDGDVILAALTKSLAGMMETAGAGKEAKLRRSPSLPVPDNSEESKREVEARTIYLKGFDKENTTLDELIDYFHNGYENVLNVQMRTWMDKKTKERCFKGSVFVTFKDEDSANKLAESKDVKYKDGGDALLIKFQKVYFEEKSKELADKKKGRQDDKDKVQKAKGIVKEEKKDDGPEFTLPKGATLCLKGMGEEITREDLKEKLNLDFGVNIDKDGGEISFITYNKGDQEAMVRFKEEDAAKPIAEKWKGMEKVEVKDTAITCELLEGEEEAKYLASSIQDLKDRRNKNKNFGGQKRRGGYQGGRGGKRGRRH